MSTMVEIESKCYICGEKSKHTSLASTNRFGPPDLDLRPPQMERSTMGWWIQECPHCGYVARDLSEKAKITKEWLKNSNYVSCDNRNFNSGLAKQFYKQYLINIEIGNHKAAFMAVLRAAWDCDDNFDENNAVYCRLKALEELEKFECSKEEKITYLLIRADLLRRTKQFDVLIKEYEGKDFCEELFNKISQFQVEKAKQKDSACYTVSDAQN